MKTTSQNTPEQLITLAMRNKPIPPQYLCACGASIKLHGVGYWTKDGYICKQCGDLLAKH